MRGGGLRMRDGESRRQTCRLLTAHRQRSAGRGRNKQRTEGVGDRAAGDGAYRCDDKRPCAEHRRCTLSLRQIV